MLRVVPVIWPIVFIFLLTWLFFAFSCLSGSFLLFLLIVFQPFALGYLKNFILIFVEPNVLRTEASDKDHGIEVMSYSYPVFNSVRTCSRVSKVLFLRFSPVNVFLVTSKVVLLFDLLFFVRNFYFFLFFSILFQTLANHFF